MIEVALWGASGHGRVVADAARRLGTHSVVGFIDDDVSRSGQAFAHTRVLGGREQLQALLSAGVSRIHIAVGHCSTRQAIASFVAAAGFSLETIIHPTAIIGEDVIIGDGCFVAAGAVVNTGTTIGSNVILNTASSVDHDCIVDSGVHIAPGARIGGLCRIGAHTFIGIGATVLNCLSVGRNSVLGAGAVLLDNLPDGVVAYGVPARVAREKRNND